MPRETPASVSAWAEATFGPAGSNASVAARANQEMAELLTALTADDRHPKAAAEVADVVIVLWRLADRLGVSAPLHGDPVLQRGNPNLSYAALANTCLSTLIRWLAAESRPLCVGDQIRNVLDYLCVLAEGLGCDLQAEIDRKMAINRAREWRLDGNGHGYHVKEAVHA